MLNNPKLAAKRLKTSATVLTLTCYIIAGVLWVFYAGGLTRAIMTAMDDPSTVVVKVKKTPEEVIFKTSEKTDGTLEYVEVKTYEKNTPKKEVMSSRDAVALTILSFVRRHTLTAILFTFFFIALGWYFESRAVLIIKTYELAGGEVDSDVSSLALENEKTD